MQTRSVGLLLCMCIAQHYTSSSSEPPGHLCVLLCGLRLRRIVLRSLCQPLSIIIIGLPTDDDDDDDDDDECKSGGRGDGK